MALLIKRVIVIANPASRRGKVLAQRAQKAFARHGVECDLLFTERAGHGAELAVHHAPLYDAIFALGGDGTVMEVAGAVAGSNTRVGVLAGGTGNLLARAMGIPLSVDRAVRSLIAGEEQLVDLGRFDNGRRMAIAAGVGIDSEMVAETPGWLKRRLGILAYVLMGSRAALRAVLGGQYFNVRMTVDGVVHEREAATVMIANFGAVLGNRITLGPAIRTDDGLLDGCIFSPRSLLDAVRIMWRMLRRDFATDPCMLYTHGSHIRVEVEPTRGWQADGELMGRTPFEVTVEPLALRLLVPRRS